MIVWSHHAPFHWLAKTPQAAGLLCPDLRNFLGIVARLRFRADSRMEFLPVGPLAAAIIVIALAEGRPGFRAWGPAGVHACSPRGLACYSLSQVSLATTPGCRPTGSPSVWSWLRWGGGSSAQGPRQSLRPACLCPDIRQVLRPLSPKARPAVPASAPRWRKDSMTMAPAARVCRSLVDPATLGAIS